MVRIRILLTPIKDIEAVENVFGFDCSSQVVAGIDKAINHFLDGIDRLPAAPTFAGNG